MYRPAALLSTLALLFCGAAAGATERLSNGFTQPANAFFRAGFWWDPQDPGWGLDLHMSGDAMVGIWATYDPEGNPTWYLGVGAREGDEWVMPLYRYRWDRFAAQPDPLAGELKLSFADGYHAQMSWTLGQSQGAAAIETFIMDPTPVYADRTGFWFETAQPGYGLSVSTQGDLVMSVFYFYDNAGFPRWAWADNGGQGAPGMELLSFRRCDGCTGGLAVASVGELQLGFQTETRGRLDATLTLAAPLQGSWNTRGRAIGLLTDPPSGRRNQAGLMPFTNPQLLDTYLRGNNPEYPAALAIDFSPAPPTELAPAVSGTNLQEQGVDEDDLLKSDGEFVFALRPRQWPETESRLRVFEIDSASPQLVEVADIALAGENATPQGMYLVTDRPDGRPDLLVVFSGIASYYDFWTWCAPGPWSQGQTRVSVYDVSDPRQPSLTHEIEVTGGGAETRRIGERLYLVTRFIPPLSTVKESLLPTFSINGVKRGPLTDPAQVFLSANDPQYPYRDITSVTAFDLGDLEATPDSVSLIGFPEALYVSLNNLYVVTSRTAYRIDPAFGGLYYERDVFTDVHQFSLADGGVRYAGTGVVPGFLPYLGVGPSFAFSEHDEHLRVLTSSRYMFQGQDHRLTVLKLAGPDAGELPVVGFMPNSSRPQPLGKPGEFLYGLRFLGDRVYAVTFKSVDPLYVVDLSKPNDPHIMGELEIPGFSDYLHPLPNDLVLGFGKNAVPAGGPGDGDFAWYQGLHLSLFDVSDPARPTLVKRVDLGRRGSESPLRYDHHALAYLPPDPAASRAGRITIPVAIADAKTPSGISPDPSHFYPWRFTGLAMFEVFGPGGEAPGLELTDVMISHHADTHPNHDYWQDWNPTAGRGLITENNVYFYLHGALYASPWEDASAVSGPY